MSTPTLDLLYIHPVFHPAPDCLPLGVTGLMNSVRCRKLGLYSNEVTEAHIRSARLVAMDLHWHHSIHAVQALAARYKVINPRLTIIIGGYTAGIYADELVSRDIDFVLRGDSDLPFKRLVEDLLGGGRGEEIPNLSSREHATPLTHQITAEEFDQLDYCTYSWFPTRQALIRASAGESLAEHDDRMNLPFVPVIRGCPYQCELCYGSPDATRTLFGRSFVARSPAAIAQDLERFSEEEDVPGVAIVGDFTDVLSDDYVSTILSRRYKLKLYYELFNLPEPDVALRLCECFTECCLTLSLYKNHGESEEMVDLGQLERLTRSLAGHPGVSIRVFNPRDSWEVPSPLKVSRLARVLSNEAWHVQVPRPGLDRKAREQELAWFQRQSWLGTAGFERFSVAAAFSGIMQPDLDLDLDLDDAASAQGQANAAHFDRPGRARFPRYLIDECRNHGSVKVPTGAGTYEGWRRRFIAKSTVVAAVDGVRQVAGQLSGTSDTSEVGFPDTGCDSFFVSCFKAWSSSFEPSRLNLGCTVRLLSSREATPRCIDPQGQQAERDTPRILRSDALFGADLDLADRELDAIEELGLHTVQLPAHPLVADACRWGAGPCTALTLARLFVDPEGALRPCLCGEQIGSAGDNNQAVLARALEIHTRVREERGCATCSARDRCSKCLALGSLSVSDYCSLMTRHPSIPDLALIPHVFRLRSLISPDMGTTAPEQLTFEISDEHALLTALVGGRGNGSSSCPSRSMLKVGVRVCLLDDRYVLLDPERLALAECPRDVVAFLATLSDRDPKAQEMPAEPHGHQWSLSDLLATFDALRPFMWPATRSDRPAGR